MRGTAIMVCVALLGACIKIPEFHGAGDGGIDTGLADGANTCPQAIDLPGLLVYMPLDAISGGMTDDLSGNNHDGAVQGGATVGPGHHGMGMVLDGGSKAINLGSPTQLDNLAAVTVCAWVNPSTIDPLNPGATIADKSTDGYTGGWNSYLDFEPTSLHVGFLAREGAWGYGGSSVPAGAWTHACTVWTGSTLTVYVNAQVETITGSGMTHAPPAHDDAANDLVLGRQTNTNQFFLNGTLDEFLLYDRPLDAAQIAAIYACSP